MDRPGSAEDKSNSGSGNSSPFGPQCNTPKGQVDPLKVGSYVCQRLLVNQISTCFLEFWIELHEHATPHTHLNTIYAQTIWCHITLQRPAMTAAHLFLQHQVQEQYRCLLPETNIAPKNRQSQKESSLPTTNFLGREGKGYFKRFLQSVFLVRLVQGHSGHSMSYIYIYMYYSLDYL